MPNAPEQLRLFLVEDSPADVYLVKEAMRREGLDCAVQVAEDGEAAIGMIESADGDSRAPVPQIVLLDVNVPMRNGNEVLERLRRSPRYANVPVVMISSSDSPKERTSAFALGATEYFRKPSTLEEFMQLGKLVRRLHRRQESAA